MNEDKEYLTLKEVAEYVGIKRTSLYYYIEKMSLKKHKFEFSNHTYLHIEDAKKIKEVKEKPWLAKEKSEEVKPEDPAA